MRKVLRKETSPPCLGHTVATMVVDSAGTVTVRNLGFSYELILLGGVLKQQQLVSFDGRISVDNSNEMRERLGAVLKLMPKVLTVDLSRVTSIDISGLATLVEATRRARRQDTQLMITGLQEQPAYLLRVTGMDQLFNLAVEQQKP